MALLSWLQNHITYNLFSISQCGSPVVTLLILASPRSEGFRGSKCWCGREMMMRRKWVNVWESCYSIRFPSPYTGFSKGGASMATTHKNREPTWKVKAPREGSKREWQEFVAGEHLTQPLAPGEEMGGGDFLHMFLVSLMDPASTHYEKNSLIFSKLSLETKMLNHCRIPSLGTAGEPGCHQEDCSYTVTCGFPAGEGICGSRERMLAQAGVEENFRKPARED